MSVVTGAVREEEVKGEWAQRQRVSPATRGRLGLRQVRWVQAVMVILRTWSSLRPGKLAEVRETETSLGRAPASTTSPSSPSTSTLWFSTGNLAPQLVAGCRGNSLCPLIIHGV